MFEDLHLPPGTYLRIEYDPERAGANLWISVLRGLERVEEIKVPAAKVRDLATLQALIDGDGRAPDPELLAEMRAQGLVDEHGHVTEEFLRTAERIVTCRGGPHDGVMLALPSVQMDWTDTARRVGTDDPMDPPPGGIYRVAPGGMYLEWHRDGAPSTTVLPFSARKKPRRRE